MELILDGIPQQVARWPNDSKIPLGTVIEGGGSDATSGDTDNGPGILEYNTERADRRVDTEDLLLIKLRSNRFSGGAAPRSLEPV